VHKGHREKRRQQTEPLPVIAGFSPFGETRGNLLVESIYDKQYYIYIMTKEELVNRMNTEWKDLYDEI
jgi:hypothetical protein